MADSGQQGDLEESSSRCTTPGEVAAGGEGLGDSMEHVADLQTDESGSSESDSEDNMDGVEEEGHDLDGDREHFADREAEELDVDAFAKELASPSVDTEAVGSRVAALSEQEEVAEDAPEDDNRGERQRRRRRRDRRTAPRAEPPRSDNTSGTSSCRTFGFAAAQVVQRPLHPRRVVSRPLCRRPTRGRRQVPGG